MNIDTSTPTVAVLPEGVAELAANHIFVGQMRRTPLYLRSNQVESFQKCIELFSKHVDELKPSKTAELAPDKVLSSQTVMMIDKIFVNSIGDYRRKLIRAGLLDLANAQLDQQIPNLTIKAAAINAARYIAKSPDIPVIKQVSIPFLAFFGALTGLFKKESIGREIKQLSTSEKRQDWIREVTILEKHRIETCLKSILQRVETIQLEIEQGDLLNVALLEELELLHSLHNFFNQGGPLTINGQPIPEFLQDLQNGLN